MVSTGKAVNFILRFLQVASAAVAAGILADYVSIVNHTDVGPGSRIVYALSITSISIFFALVLLYPSSKYYYSFPLDLCLGICLIVAAGLLTALTGSAGCNSRWYVTHWGWAWGGWWRRVPAQRIVASQVDGAGCGSWKASVGLCYIAGFWWLGSFVLGLCVLYDRRTQAKDLRRHGEVVMSEPSGSKADTSLSMDSEGERH